jgi:hypothetical protein
VLTFYLFDLGMKLLGAIANATANAIKGAVDTLVNAYTAFLNAVVAFALSIAHVILDPILSAIGTCLYSLYRAAKAASDLMTIAISVGGVMMDQARRDMSNAIFGDMFVGVLAIAIAVQIIFYLVKGITFGLGFVVSVIGTAILGLVVQNILGSALGTYDGDQPQNSTKGGITDFLESFFLIRGKTQNAVDKMVGQVSSFWCIIEFIPAMVMSEAMGCVREAAISIMAMVLAFYAIVDHDARLTALAMAFTLFAFLKTITSQSFADLDRELRIAVGIMSGAGVALVALNIVTIWV